MTNPTQLSAGVTQGGKTPPCPFTHLHADYLDKDYESQKEGWRIHDFPDEPKHVAHWIAGGLEEDDAKFIVYAVNSTIARLSSTAALEAEKAQLVQEVHRLRSVLVHFSTIYPGWTSERIEHVRALSRAALQEKPE